ncbi:MAG TPA: Cof-type HAD-IIB family hydrolase [Buchnera sp. (in: enterobacteria)]|nr:Cof-type HAD-IIB family hydrolase [Buchnera sp. (in: enterobacteria)]
MYDVIVVDLDGTLLSSEHKVTDYTKKIIQTLYKKKFYLVFATGCHYFEVLKICNYCQVSAFMITSNGAKIYDLNRDLIFTCSIKKDIIIKLLNNIDLGTNIVMHMYCNNQWYINKTNIEQYFCHKGSSFKYKVLDFNSFTMDNVSKVFFTSNNCNQLSLLKKKIECLFNKDLNLSFSSTTCFEIMSKKVSKGNALIFLMKYLKISLKNCISFGNAMNDIEMLRISGKACIVQNADLELINQLPHIEVIKSNNEDGVASYLDCLYKINYDNIK